ncbi:MAG: VacJ family lipoprotein [Rhizorhabdus sp.]|nr:VacJ family lipoprotein [Rhizorhabdus sp.]
MRFPAKVLPILVAASALTACTTTNVGTDRLAERDPLEGFNRGVFAVNRGLDKVVLKPVTQVYRAVTPKPARQGVSNFFANLSEPFSFINNILQGKPDRAVRNLGRFLVNTTTGVGGLFDNAKRFGIKPADEDLGQTFAAWGMNGGPYLMLPILGPTTMRDGVGMGAAQFTDPYRVCLSECGLPHGVPLALTGAQIIDVRSQLIEQGADNFLEASLDPYAATRSAYLQRRRAAILNQEGGDAAAEAAAEAAAAADAEANPIGAGPTTAPDADAGVTPPPATDAAPAQPAAQPPAATPQ